MNQNIKAVHDLAPMQKGMFFQSLYSEKSSDYVGQMILSLQGHVNKTLFKKSIDLLIERYDVLRTAFVHKKLKQPVQVVLHQRDSDFTFIDACKSKQNTKTLIQDTIDKEREKGFDLTKDILIRFTLIQIAPQEYKLLITNHHIIVDGWCIGIIVNDFSNIYRQLSQGNPPALEPVAEYSRYIDWLNKQDTDQAYQFWQRYLSDLSAPTALPFIRPASTYRKKEFIIDLDESTSNQLVQLARTNGATLSNVLQSLWGILLCKYGNTDEAIIGTVVSGRPAELENVQRMVGLFINTLPIRIRDINHHTFSSLITEIHKETVECEQYGYIPLGEIQQQTENKTQLFDHLFALQNYYIDKTPEKHNDSLLTIKMERGFEQVNYDFGLVIVPWQKIRLRFFYNVNAVDDRDMNQVAGYLTHLIEKAIKNPFEKINHVSLLTQGQRQEILDRFNNTRNPYPHQKTLDELFQEQVREIPDQVAITSQTMELTFAELDHYANQVARCLKSKRVTPEQVIPLFIDKSAEMIIGMLGIIKAGAAYLPIDIDYPRERIEYMIKDCNARFVLSRSALAQDFSSSVEWIDIQKLAYGESQRDDFYPEHTPKSLAYVMYTSGSTGKPKGVMIEHRNIVRLVKNIDYVKFDRNTRLLQAGAPVFDATTWEVWGALLNGGKLVLADKTELLDGATLEQLIRTHNINTMLLTSALFNQIVDQDPNYLDGLDYLLIGGDIVSPAHVRKVYKNNNAIRMINAYGPTENGVISTCYQIKEPILEKIPIGSPISNSFAYIVDQKGDLQPIGIEGELWVGGDGVGRGYMNQPELTAEKFIKNPFSPADRVYRTGDMARWQQTGIIDFLGRRDDQVKLRGFRIECKEIEKCIQNHPKIKDNLVLMRGHDHDKTLVCYYIALEELDRSELQHMTARHLPEYMIPSFFIRLEAFPLTLNGKVDRKALPEPHKLKADAVAPGTITELKLFELWKSVLNLDQISVTDNFFAIGGHSLKAMNLISLVSKVFDVDIRLAEIFAKPTIRELAPMIDRHKKNNHKHIQPTEKKSNYKASFAQQRMIALSHSEENSLAYNIPHIYAIHGPLDVDRLQTAFQMLIERHESLRTCFEIDDGQVHQIVKDRIPFNIEYLKSDAENRELARQFIQPFDTSQAPLFRVALVERPDNSYLLMTDFHHAICDGESIVILLTELKAIYENRSLSPLALQYKDYTNWQHDLLENGDLLKQLEFWRSQFSNDVPVLDFPTDYVRPSRVSTKGKTIHFCLTKSQSEKLQKLSAGQNVTLYMLTLAIFKILVARLSQQQDIILGTPTAGRNHSALHNVVGMFVNTVAIRSQPCPDNTFNEYLKDLKETLVQAFENQDLQFDTIVDDLKLQRDTSRNPLFDIMYVWQNFGTDELKTLEMGDIRLEPLEPEFATAKFDMTWVGYEKNQHLHFIIEYCTDLFKSDRIERMQEQFSLICDQIIDNPNIELGNINILTSSDRLKIFEQFNDTEMTIPEELTLVQMFEEQVIKKPDQVALIGNGKKLSFNELNKQANRLGHYLQSRGLKQGDIAAILLPQSCDLVVSILAILKAGAAFLPLDPKAPKERLQFQLRDSQAQTLVTTYELAEHTNYSCQIIEIGQEEKESDEHINCARPGDSCYIIYTSGSTGRPKGVLVDHRSIANTLVWRTQEYALSTEDTALQVLSQIFDGFIVSLFTPLLSGATVFMATESQSKNVQFLAGLLEKQKITHFAMVPTLYDTLLDHIKTDKNVQLKTITLAGERLDSALVKKSKAILSNVMINNEYGPTENAVASSICRDIKPGKPITIGQPIPNVKAHIVDKQGQPLPIGVPGELWLAGAGLAKGYLNQPELTAEKFVPNPFGPGRIYKSGDIVRWTSEGNLDFLGRIDNQVKINGLRIELGEIENVLNGFPQVEKSLTVVKKGQSPYIVAYYVAKAPIDQTALTSHVSNDLPHYMIPAVFHHLESFPLLPNGKIDANSLPDPENIDRSFIKPTGPTATMLCELWKNLFEKDKISATDHFFALGGHSLKAMTLVSQIEKQFNVNFTLSDVFKVPVLCDMAAHIDSLDNRTYSQIPRIKEQEYYAVSPAQKRLYALQQIDNESTLRYNIPLILNVQGKPDTARLEEAIDALIDKHETLRTRFITKNGEIYAHILDRVRIDLVNKTCPQDQVQQTIKQFIRPFQLDKAPLFRAMLIDVSDPSEKHLLILDFHHIIADGESMRPILNDLADAYAGKELSPLRIQYKDYAAWQRDQKDLAKQELFWLEMFQNNIPVLNLATDYPRPLEQSLKGDTFTFLLDTLESKLLKNFSRSLNMTPYMVGLTFFYILLAKYSGQQDLVIGTPIAGRNHFDLKDMIGMFVNTLAIRLGHHPDMSIQELALEVKDIVLQAFANQEYPFDQLVEKLDIRRDMSRNPLFDVMFTWQKISDSENLLKNSRDISLGIEELDHKVSKFDLILNGLEKDDTILFSINYCTDLFKKQTIEQMAGHIKMLCGQLVNPAQKIKNLSLVSKAQKAKILDMFNNTRVEYDREKTLDAFYEEQANLFPEHIAVKSDQGSLTYAELDSKSTLLAAYLQAQGIKHEAIVGLYVGKGLEMIIGMLAIIKSGAAYMPIDLDSPKDRISFMIDDSACTAVLTTRPLAAKLPSKVNTIDISESEDNKSITKIHKANSLAYVMYTSGSTGRPKGVMIEHRNITRLVKSPNAVNFDPKTRLLQTGAPVFDATTWEVWGPLLNGGQLFLVNKDEILDVGYLGERIKKHEINTMWLTSGLFNLVIDQDPACLNGLHWLIIGGDIVSPKHVKIAQQVNPELQIINGYGPTENCVFSTLFLIIDSTQKSIPIGGPIANSTVYIVDEMGELQPIGIEGEIWVGGDGVGRGYMNRPSLTGEKFTPDHFLGEGRLYRTGDLGRWLRDGTIEFNGRMDTQIKLAGFRIECKEIQAVLKKRKSIQDCLVTVFEQQDQKRLCCYYKSDKEQDPSELRQELARQLPSYMIPAVFIHLIEFPITTNGKIDKSALPTPVTRSQSGPKTAPENDKEERLLQLWKQVLGNIEISTTDNFFDLGGDSILAIRMASLANTVDLTFRVNQLMKHATIKELAEVVTEGSNPDKEPQTTEITGEIPIMPIIQYHLSQSDKERHIFTIETLYKTRETMDTEALQHAVQAIISEHPALRLETHETDEGWKQVIAPTPQEPPLEIHDLSQLTQHEILKQTEILIKLNRSRLQLNRGGLLRMLYIKTPASESNILIMIIHHFAIDQVSMGILRHDFFSAYRQYRTDKKISMPPVPASIKQVAEEYVEKIEEGVFDSELKYWLHLPVEKLTPLPVDYAGEKFNSKNCCNLATSMDPEASKRLIDRIKREKLMMNDFLLYAIAKVMAEWSQNPYQLILQEENGRAPDVLDLDLSRTVGWLAYRYPQLFHIDDLQPFTENIKQNKTRLNVPQKGLGFGLLKQYHPQKAIREQLQKIPEPEIGLFYHGKKYGSFSGRNKANSGHDLEIENRETESKKAIRYHKIYLFCGFFNDVFHMNWEYASNMYNKETLDFLADQMINLMMTIADQESPELVKPYEHQM